MRLQAIFHRQISGDQALLELAQRRFHDAGLGPEFYPGSPEQLREELRFHPLPGRPYTVHLPRDIRLTEASGRERVLDFAAAADPYVTGYVVHDQLEPASRFDQYVEALKRLDRDLEKRRAPGLVFVEYAAGLQPETFVRVHEAVRDCAHLGACIDISHIGIWQCQHDFARRHPGENVFQLKPHHPGLRERVESVQQACCTALPVVLEVIAALGRLGKLLHFHLHDGHPASTFSRYGVSDHLSFFMEIPIPFSWRGSHVLPLLYGPLGLQKISAAACAVLPEELLSFTLEIHAPEGQQALGEHAPLFRHWSDRTNAERMQHWIEVLLRNHRLLLEACTSSST